MTKRPFYEYSEPASPPWEAKTLVPFFFLLLETGEALPVNGDWQLLLLCLLHAANSSFTSFVYTLMQSSTPISPFHKGDKSFLWKPQPESSVYAELKRFGFYANEFWFDFSF